MNQILDVSINAGFPFSDVPFVGASVLVTFAVEEEEEGVVAIDSSSSSSSSSSSRSSGCGCCNEGGTSSDGGGGGGVSTIFNVRGNNDDSSRAGAGAATAVGAAAVAAETLAKCVATSVASAVWRDRGLISSEIVPPEQAAAEMMAAAEIMMMQEERQKKADSGAHVGHESHSYISSSASSSSPSSSPSPSSLSSSSSPPCSTSSSSSSLSSPSVVVIDDYADNPGGGGYGDATNLLRALLAAKVKSCAFGCITDPEAAQVLTQHFIKHRQHGPSSSVGAVVERIRIGGKTDGRFGGGPLVLSGSVVHASDGCFVGDGPMLRNQKQCLGTTAVFRVTSMHEEEEEEEEGGGGAEEDTRTVGVIVAHHRGGGASGGDSVNADMDGSSFDVIVCSNCLQVLDAQTFTSQGIVLDQKACVVVKSMVHFRAAFTQMARRVILADGGGLVSPSAYTKTPPAPSAPSTPSTAPLREEEKKEKPPQEDDSSPKKRLRVINTRMMDIAAHSTSTAAAAVAEVPPFAYLKARRPLYPLDEIDDPTPWVFVGLRH
jgi:hypothetical protein